MTPRAETPLNGVRETLAQVLESIVVSWDAGQIDNYGATDLILAVIEKAGSAARSAPEPGECADLRAAVELMDTKVTPYGEREDGTASAYIVADSTWHRVLAIARGSTSDKARAALSSQPEPGEGLRAVLDEATALIELGENRAMATDGPVPHFRGELDDREWRQLWLALGRVRTALGGDKA